MKKIILGIVLALSASAVSADQIDTKEFKYNYRLAAKVCQSVREVDLKYIHSFDNVKEVKFTEYTVIVDSDNKVEIFFASKVLCENFKLRMVKSARGIR